MSEIIDKLNSKGVNTAIPLSCVGNNEALYIKLLTQFFTDPDFDSLEKAAREQRNKEAFEYAHALKGMAGNLGLTNLYEQLSIIVEQYRYSEEQVVGDHLERLRKEWEETFAILK